MKLGPTIVLLFVASYGACAADRSYPAPEGLRVDFFQVCDRGRAVATSKGSRLQYWAFGQKAAVEIGTGNVSAFACDPTASRVAAVLEGGDGHSELRVYTGDGKLLETLQLAGDWSFPPVDR